MLLEVTINVQFCERGRVVEPHWTKANKDRVSELMHQAMRIPIAEQQIRFHRVNQKTNGDNAVFTLCITSKSRTSCTATSKLIHTQLVKHQGKDVRIAQVSCSVSDAAIGQVVVKGGDGWLDFLLGGPGASTVLHHQELGRQQDEESDRRVAQDIADVQAALDKSNRTTTNTTSSTTKQPYRKNGRHFTVKQAVDVTQETDSTALIHAVENEGYVPSLTELLHIITIPKPSTTRHKSTKLPSSSRKARPSIEQERQARDRSIKERRSTALHSSPEHWMRKEETHKDQQQHAPVIPARKRKVAVLTPVEERENEGTPAKRHSSSSSRNTPIRRESSSRK